MPETQVQPRVLGDRSLYVDGYFSTRIFNGETPTYGYPGNHLPVEVGTATMQVVPGYVAALKSGKK